jgi:hypothetical protein
MMQCRTPILPIRRKQVLEIAPEAWPFEDRKRSFTRYNIVLHRSETSDYVFEEDEQQQQQQQQQAVPLAACVLKETIVFKKKKKQKLLQKEKTALPRRKVGPSLLSICSGRHGSQAMPPHTQQHSLTHTYTYMYKTFSRSLLRPAMISLALLEREAVVEQGLIAMHDGPQSSCPSPCIRTALSVAWLTSVLMVWCIQANRKGEARWLNKAIKRAEKEAAAMAKIGDKDASRAARREVIRVKVRRPLVHSPQMHIRQCNTHDIRID